MWETIGRWMGRATEGVTRDQISGLVQRALAVAVGYAVGKKWIPQEYASDIIAGLGMVIVALWSISANRKKALVESVARQGDIVVSDAATARAVPDEKVVAKANVVVLDKSTKTPILDLNASPTEHPVYPTGNVGGGKV